METELTRTDREAVERLTRTFESGGARMVFGEPVTTGDVTVIPAARIIGCGGGDRPCRSRWRDQAGGTGSQPDQAGGTGSQPDQAGGGLMMIAKPVGAFVLKGDDVHWRPAIDINKIVAGGQLVAVVALLTARALFGRRRR